MSFYITTTRLFCLQSFDLCRRFLEGSHFHTRDFHIGESVTWFFIVDY